MWGIFDDEDDYKDMLARTQPENFAWQYPSEPNHYFPSEANFDDDEENKWNDWWWDD